MSSSLPEIPVGAISVTPMQAVAGPSGGQYVGGEVVVAFDGWLAVSLGIPQSDGKAQALARLLAAAPSLLRCLERYVQVFGDDAAAENEGSEEHQLAIEAIAAIEAARS